MTWAALYLALLAALFVRVHTTPGPPPAPQRPLPDEPLHLVMLHHRLFYALLLATPVEAALLGGRPDGRLVGVVLFAAGVALYRRGGADLGESRSPFVLPKPGTALVRGGLYRRIRHPMYLGQMLIALGAPLTLGARWTLALAGAAVVVLVVRMAREDAALRAAHADFADYAARTKRLVPWVF